MADNMLTQVTGRGVIKPLKGILLVLGLVISFFLLDMLLRGFVMLGLNSTVATIILYVLVVLLFLYILRRFCLVHMYTMDNVRLLLYRVYIRNPRLSEQILFRECVYFGSPVTAAKKFAISRTSSYIGHRDIYAVQSLVVKKGNKYRQILLTPNEQLCAAILTAVKNR